MFSNRDIYCSGISREASVRDFLSVTPPSSAMYSTFCSWGEPIPLLALERNDKLLWLEHHFGDFSIASAWNFMRDKSPLVHWDSFVWDRSIIPRHAFLLWLITLNRLPTQVLLLGHSRIDQGLCAFCNLRPDSIEHLFFGCRITGSLARWWARKCNLVWTNRGWQNNL